MRRESAGARLCTSEGKMCARSRTMVVILHETRSQSSKERLSSRGLRRFQIVDLKSTRNLPGGTDLLCVLLAAHPFGRFEYRDWRVRNRSCGKQRCRCLQLAHVARPMVCAAACAAFMREPGNRDARASCVIGGEVFQQRLDVLRPLAQRRNRQIDRVEQVVQLLTERA